MSRQIYAVDFNLNADIVIKIPGHSSAYEENKSISTNNTYGFLYKKKKVYMTLQNRMY